MSFGNPGFHEANKTPWHCHQGAREGTVTPAAAISTSPTPCTPPHRLSAAQFILVFTDQPKVRGVPSGGRGVREEKEVRTIGPLTSLGIVSSWELVGVVASSPIQGTEGKCYASCLQEGQDTTNEILKKETYRKERKKKEKRKEQRKIENC